jgi:hypothetical protein
MNSGAILPAIGGSVTATGNTPFPTLTTGGRDTTNFISGPAPIASGDAGMPA